MAAATKARPARATKATQPEPVATTTVDDPTTTGDETSDAGGQVQVDTVEAIEPSSGIPFPALSPTQLRAMREGLGVSRQAVATMSGLTVSAIWRVENGRKATDDEFTALAGTLRKIDQDGFAEGVRPKKPSGVTRAALESRAKTALLILEEAASKKTVKELQALCEQVAAALAGAGDVTASGGDA